MADSPDVQSAAILRNLNTGMLALLIALVGYVSNTVVSLDKRQAVIEEGLAGIKFAQTQAYSRSAAERDYTEMRGRVEKLEVRIDRIDEMGTSAHRRHSGGK